MITWKPDLPIFRQVKDHLLNQILDGSLGPGDPLPSIRQVAASSQINPITVSRAYQELVDENLAEKRRGVGFYVSTSAPTLLRDREREQFLTHHWPNILARIEQLGLQLSALPTLSSGERS